MALLSNVLPMTFVLLALCIAAAINDQETVSYIFGGLGAGNELLRMIAGSGGDE